MQDRVFQEALDRFTELFDQAQRIPATESAAMTLATADADGRPSARIVLLRKYDERGFVYFTNAESRKAREIAANPRAALCFYWDALHHQVRIEGRVDAASDAESDAYWLTRSRESQIGAWASDQSRPLDRRETFEARLEEIETRFADADVPRPPHWHGFRVAPDYIEIWHGRPARLHERTVYEQQPDGWTRRLLYP